ncbi:MAG: hypothetical protein PVH45_02780 [Candidatus Omnitrophota bacterium]|jgi:hypothetical protein
MKIKQLIIFLSAGLSILLLFQPVLAQDKERLVEYPDRSYGIDLGDDWQVTSDGEFIGDSATRGEYRDSRFGPTTDAGFVLFKDFHWVKPKEKEPEERVYYYIYHEATTAPPPEEPAESPAGTEKKETGDVYIGEADTGMVYYKATE